MVHCPCRKGSPLVTDPWEVEVPHSQRRSGRHPHRSEEQHRRQSGCPSATRRHPPRRTKEGEGEGGEGVEE